MAIKMFRCANPKCRKANKGTFFAEIPKCPQCGIEANDPKYGRLIGRCALVHFDPPSPVPGIGLNVRACDPAKVITVASTNERKPSWHAGTGNPKGVTCPQCKETRAYQAAIAGLDDELPPTETLTAAAASRIEPLLQRV